MSKIGFCRQKWLISGHQNDNTFSNEVWFTSEKQRNIISAFEYDSQRILSKLLAPGVSIKSETQNDEAKIYFANV